MSETAALLFRDLLPVLALLAAVALGARWWLRRNGGMAGVRVVARTGITKGTVVAVIESDGRRFLVGGGEHGLTVLADLGEAAAADTAPEPDATPPPRTLASTLADMRRPGRATPSSGPRTGPVDRLRAMTVRTAMSPAGPDAHSPG